MNDFIEEMTKMNGIKGKIIELCAEYDENNRKNFLIELKKLSNEAERCKIYDDIKKLKTKKEIIDYIEKEIIMTMDIYP